MTSEELRKIIKCGETSLVKFFDERSGKAERKQEFTT